MSKVFYIKETILSFLLTFFFGMRTQTGEPINLDYGVEQPKHTYVPEEQPDQYSWMEEHRVSSLHGVKQNVHLEG
jgi:hypothetical protein